MDNIPVTFTYNGKEYRGYFPKVMGAGSTAMFHLNVGRFYWGRLRFSEFTNNWCFDATPKNPEMENLANEFGDIIISWYQ